MKTIEKVVDRVIEKVIEKKIIYFYFVVVSSNMYLDNPEGTRVVVG